MPRPPPAGPSPEILATIQVFIDGFTFTRSFTHPFVAERFGPLQVVRDAPRKRAADYRTEEWIACGPPPAEVHRLVTRHHRGQFAICELIPADVDPAPIRAAYKKLGYRLRATEALMSHGLKRIPVRRSPAEVARVLTAGAAEALNRAAGRRQLLPEHLHADAPIRSYAAVRDGKVVGWVSSIFRPAGTWCANMYVQPKHRRQGIASALLAVMLRDDRRAGAPVSVLTASHAGAKLYETLGYRRLGDLLLYSPVRP